MFEKFYNPLGKGMTREQKLSALRARSEVLAEEADQLEAEYNQVMNEVDPYVEQSDPTGWKIGAWLKEMLIARGMSTDKYPFTKVNGEVHVKYDQIDVAREPGYFKITFRLAGKEISTLRIAAGGSEYPETLSLTGLTASQGITIQP